MSYKKKMCKFGWLVWSGLCGISDVYPLPSVPQKICLAVVKPQKSMWYKKQNDGWTSCKSYVQVWLFSIKLFRSSWRLGNVGVVIVIVW